MAVRCPYCQHAVSFKDAKPGRYSPKCPKCERKFSLTVPAEAGAEAVAQVLAESDTAAQPAATTAATPATVEAATGVWAGATAPGNGQPAATGVFASGPAEINATGEWGTAAAPAAEATMAHRAGAATEAGRSGSATIGGNGTAGGTLPPGTPHTLGGYRLVKELGRGGMGSVYLAKQLSLDRNVALKVMQPQWSRDATFVSRFTREAYAAAQLVHHNVVQIYDIGRDHDTNYFSMEFVEGQSLSDVVKEHGKLDVEQAVGYILQAARGLKFAHDQGMIHRDIKPDNLMLNRLGVVKVADLGLVKAPGAAAEAAPNATDRAGLAAVAGNVTLANVAMGTPAYMSPEQGENAAGVDHRADIYSLGCTLYVMLVGRPPFEGRTALEVITKHKSEPIVRPEAIVNRVPKELSDILMKMVAKRPDDRYANLDEVIKSLEGFLGVQSAGPFTPKEEHAQTLEQAVRAFNSSPAARLRPKLVLGYFGVLLAVFLICGLLGRLTLAGGIVGLAVMSVLCYFIVSGAHQRSHLFNKVRELVLGSRWTDWLTRGVGLLLFTLVLWLLNLLVMWLAFCIAAVGIALAFHFLIDRKVAAERAAPLAQVEDMLKTLRLRGLEETALRQFVSKYSGDHWEEFYEALFGYEAKLDARQEWSKGERGRARAKFRAWRDPLVGWIDERLRARREQKEVQHLQQVEENGLKAKGVSAEEAKEKAAAAAQAMVGQAAELRAAASMAVLTARVPADPTLRKLRIKAMLEANETIAPAPKRPIAARVAAGPLALAFGGRTRFLVGGLLMAACLLWVRQNSLFSAADAERLKELATQTVQTGEVQDTSQIEAKLSQETRPLSLPLLPQSLAGALFNSFNPGLAGLFLAASAFFRGPRIAAFAFPAAAVTWLGGLFGLPEFGASVFHANLSAMVIGAGIMAAGVFFARNR